MKPLSRKLRLRDQDPVLLLNCPEELQDLAAEITAVVHSAPAPGIRYPFVLAFARSLAEATRLAGEVRVVRADQGMFWLAYPKKTSRRYRGLDIDRDSGFAAVEPLGFRFVSMVALDEDWSAMRFAPREG